MQACGFNLMGVQNFYMKGGGWKWWGNSKRSKINFDDKDEIERFDVIISHSLPYLMFCELWQVNVKCNLD